MTRRLALWLPAAACAVLLFARLGRPALWQDEAETALLAESVLEHGYPSVRLEGRLISGQPDLKAYESAPGGAWIWDTWAPYYLCAASLALFGRTAWAARLPFAVAAFLAFLLAGRLFRVLSPRDRLASFLAEALLAVNVPWLLFMRQCRYYSLACLGTLAALLAYRRVLKGRPGAPALLAFCLLFLLNTFFALGLMAMAVLAADALLRRREPGLLRRAGTALAASAILFSPAALYFKVWTRPGIHLYGLGESLRFLETYGLWIQQFAAASPVLLVYFLRREGGAKGRRGPVLAAAYVLAVLAFGGEDALGAAMSLAAWSALAVWSVSKEPPKGELSGRHLGLWLAGGLALFSLKGAEPYARYLSPFLPFFCFAMGVWLSEAGTAAGAVLAGACLACNLLYVAPVRLAAALRTKAPAETVSAVMRSRLRDVPFRSDPASFAGELWRGPSGYVEPIAAVLLEKGGAGQKAFASSDNLCYMFYTKLDLLDPEELGTASPDWLIPSPWLEFQPRAKARVEALLESGGYETVEVAAPALLWQNNPDILYHIYRPLFTTRTLFRLQRTK